MAHFERVFFPDGGHREFYKDENDTWQRIVEEVILPRYYEYCDSHWISANHKEVYAAEKQVKRFLDKCAYLISLDNQAGLESAYKANVKKEREIAVSDLPEVFENVVYSNSSPSGNVSVNKFLRNRDDLKQKQVVAKRKNFKREKLRSTKISDIHKQFPKAQYSWVRVLTDNTFMYDGMQFKIDDHVKQYKAKKVKGDVLYDMDSVLVVWNDHDGARLYDQNIDELKPDEFWIVQ